MELLTKAEKLRQEQSRLRQRTIELNKADELTDEQRTELDQAVDRLEGIEPEIRAATTAEAAERAEREAEAREAGHVDAETRERVELRSKAQLTNYFTAFSRGRLVDGAEAELAKAAAINDGSIPIEIFDVPQPEQRQTEARAVTPAPSTVGVNLAPIVPAVFSQSIAPRLGIEMPRVMSGTYASATITTNQTASAKTKGDAIAATAGALTVTSTGVRRISARLELTLEDVATIGQANFESILRQNTSLVLSDELDKQAINGNGTAPNLAGLLSRLTSPTDPTNVAGFDDFVAAFAGGVDGLWADSGRAVSMAVGADTFRLAMRLFRDASDANKRGDVSFASYAMDHYGGFWTNARMPATASNIQKAILYRTGRPGMRTAVCPHWGEIGIDDVYSGSASGIRSFTLHVLLGDVILTQPAAYSEVEFKVS